MICREEEKGRLHVRHVDKVCALRRAHNIVVVAFPKSRLLQLVTLFAVYLDIRAEETSG